MEGAISTALERNLFVWSLFQEGRWTQLFHVCHVLLTDCLCFCRVVFHKCMLGDSAFLRQFNYVITNTCGLTYGITFKAYTGSNCTIFNPPDRFQPFHTMENCWWWFTSAWNDGNKITSRYDCINFKLFTVFCVTQYNNRHWIWVASNTLIPY